MDSKLTNVGAGVGLLAAANDDGGRTHKQHKGNPIAGTFLSIKGYPPTLRLFKVHGSPFFYVGLYRRGRKLKNTTKTEKLADAQKAAKKFFEEILLKESQNLPLTKGSSFQRVALDLFKEDSLLAQPERGELAKRTVSERKRIYDHDLLPFFGNDNIRDLSYVRLQQ